MSGARRSTASNSSGNLRRCATSPHASNLRATTRRRARGVSAARVRSRDIDLKDIPERYRRIFTENPFFDHFELDVVSYGNGSSVLRFPYKKEFTQYQGVVQGGI